MTLPNPCRGLNSGMRKSGWAVASLFIAAACSSKEAPGGADTDGAVVDCTHDPRVDTYTANLKHDGMRSMLEFTLVDSNPAPPARGSNVLTLKVTQKDGTAMGGRLTANLKMPDHGHETSVQPTISFDAASSSYTIDPAYLFMPGVWRIQFDEYGDAEDAGTSLDTGVFYFCIEG